MARTNHHRHQRHSHWFKDFTSKMRCNQGCGAHYGVMGRDIANVERRADDKRVVRKEIADFSI